MPCDAARGAGLLPAATAFEEVKLAGMEAGEEGRTGSAPTSAVTVSEASRCIIRPRVHCLEED